MAVTIRNLLSNALFKDSVIVAGKKGLENEIGRINFIDCPFPEDIKDSGLINKGDLFINSFYIVREDQEKLADYIKAYIDCACSGTFIITEFIQSLNQDILDLCDEARFPVIFIDPSVPYAEIIKTTMEMILSDKSDTILEMKIEKIIEQDVSRRMIVEVASEVNPLSSEYYASLFIKPEHFPDKKMQLFAALKNLRFVEPVPYKGGVFLLLNFNKTSALPSYLNQLESEINKYYLKCNIGISTPFAGAESFNVCLKQSLLAYEIAHILNDNTVYYKDVSLYKILYPLKESEVLKDFYDDIITPLKGSDGSDDPYELIRTIEAYLYCDGDFKKTAQLINQHENTVRYRISKAKRLLHFEHDHFKFIEQVSVALKIKNLLK